MGAEFLPAEVNSWIFYAHWLEDLRGRGVFTKRKCINYVSKFILQEKYRFTGNILSIDLSKSSK